VNQLCHVCKKEKAVYYSDAGAWCLAHRPKKKQLALTLEDQLPHPEHTTSLSIPERLIVLERKVQEIESKLKQGGGDGNR